MGENDQPVFGTLSRPSHNATQLANQVRSEFAHETDHSSCFSRYPSLQLRPVHVLASSARDDVRPYPVSFEFFIETDTGTNCSLLRLHCPSTQPEKRVEFVYGFY